MQPAPEELASAASRGKVRAFLVKTAGLTVWFCVAVIVVCLVVKEFYPFSHFPMYSKMAPSSYTLYVTDGEDKILFTVPEFDVQSSILKKMFVTQINKLKHGGSIQRYDQITKEEYQAIGGEILQWLIEKEKNPSDRRCPDQSGWFKRNSKLLMAV